GPGFNASTNKGDICRYISDRGWVQGKWRLPTSDEQQALINEVTSVSNNGGFGNITGAPNTGNNAHGFWQVPSGRWLGAGAAADAARNTGKAAELVPGSSSVYFPAGGYRNVSNGNTSYAGSVGYSWSASSYTTAGAYSLYVNSGTAYWYGCNRNDGFTVRCIRE
ncbi:FISUMP domain-containing protein, partial [uncultured Parabacteroides sp.]|uniref:FISUMP domain-containing protein n=1 Tax=uncultured Parabacteroides sp. TaxID=512312 RepID=UPI0025E5AC68